MIPSINKAITDAIAEDDIVVCVPAGNGNGDVGRAIRMIPVSILPLVRLLSALRDIDPELNLRRRQ